jgi:hypothetical protein
LGFFRNTQDFCCLCCCNAVFFLKPYAFCIEALGFFGNTQYFCCLRCCNAVFFLKPYGFCIQALVFFGNTQYYCCGLRWYSSLLGRNAVLSP